MPDLEVEDWSRIACVITRTGSGRPVFSSVSPGVLAVVGGNGHAAKSGDERGRLAVASLLHGDGWNAGYSATEFAGSADRRGSG